MTTFDLNPDEITAALRKRMEGYSPTMAANQVGRVVEVGDGIARVGGLPGASVNELLEFVGGKIGIDATHKWTSEGAREWPDRIVMSDEVRDLVDRRWDEYGIDSRESVDIAQDGRKRRILRPLRQSVRH